MIDSTKYQHAHACRILVVDDNLFQRKLLTLHLEMMGFAPIALASSTAEAADRLTESHDGGHPFQLIVLDWHLPGMQGDQFLAQCRADARFKSLPIIMVTAESEPKNIQAALKNGATSYLVKPVSYSDLKKRVRQVFEQTDKDGA